MPLILPPKTWRLWLGEDAAEPEQLKAVLRPLPSGGHDHVARTRVGNMAFLTPVQGFLTGPAIPLHV